MVRKQLSEAIHSVLCVLVLLLATQCASSRPNDLGMAVWTNGQCQFSLMGWGGIRFVVESSPDMVNWTPVQTNTASSAAFPVTVPATNDVCFFRTVTRRVLAPYPSPFAYVWGAATNINFVGNQFITDSYNSGDTNLSTNGQYDPLKASTNGNVASVGGLVNAGRYTINGNLYLGPTATYTGNPTNVTGTIYPNYTLQFPHAILPIADNNSNAIVWMSAPGTTNSHDFTASGYYAVNDSGYITVEPGVAVKLMVTPQNYNPSTITIKGGMTNSGSIVMYHNPPNPGGYAVLSGNSVGGPIGNRPPNFVYFGLPNVSSVTLSGIADFVGAIYAPDAYVEMNGGGNPLSVCGSIIAGQITDNGRYYLLHFDESLLTAGPFDYHYTYTWP